MMKEKISYPIDNVSPGSPAAISGIQAGWKLVRIDNQPVKDIIDYKIMEADENLRLLVQSDKGLLHRIKVKKPAGVPLGLGFDPPTMSDLQRCRNKCIFCFIEQNPPNMRPALYVKDEDYRLSFLYGNFITLNSLDDLEFERIIKLQLSPLYVSVHTTNPALRRIIFGTKHADRGLKNLKRLLKAGIRIHAQVVLCPGYNTGLELERTIRDLDQWGPNLTDIALVPVGLTAHRSALLPLRKFSPEEAKKMVEEIENMQEEFLKTRNSRFVFLADEFYVMAGVEFPGNDYYEGYPQLENGVGLARQFLSELAVVSDQELPIIKEKLTVTVAAGKAAEVLLKTLIKEFSKIDKLIINLVVVENRFFGEPVNVSGLLTGSDLLAALEGKEQGDLVFIANTLLREKSDIFLDDMTITELEKSLKVPIRPVSGPMEMLKIIRDIAAAPKL
jgi:putative radical SAM enzyme (TIGR03279 family)